MQDAVIVSGVRTPIGRAFSGRLKDVRADELAALALRSAVERTPGLDPGEIEDVVMGCAIPEGEQGLNIARLASLRAGFPSSVPGFTVNRFCSSGLQAISIAAERIRNGSVDIIVAGGVESMSRIPMMGFRPAPNPMLVEEYPQAYMGMGLTAEQVAVRYEVSRDDQDEFSFGSHQKADSATSEGRFAEEIVPVPRSLVDPQSEGILLQRDEGIRTDTSINALSSLKPAFQMSGSVTAGNSSQMSDAAAAVVVMSDRKASELGLEARAIYRSFAVAGVDPDVMGIGPVEAVPRALEEAGLTVADIGLIELNEAFAAQSLAVIRALEFDPEIVNVNGGAIALGHPLGCTGARQTITIMNEASRRQSIYGLVTMCIGGGMGAAGVFEFPS
ncbi:MAG: thiolase family protein [SAR202 cluster bacterium]|jgi:acetyl-CoA acyltransferase|nr:thiolase family protein [SAR202 cluster bacterium]|tara:strand:+ start:3418 stop:4581 length:1164 start_codon:yes stop_codon:yes gene_type:complete